MGKDKNSFVFYRSFYDALSKCTPKVRCEVLDAILSYSFEGIMPKMTALADTLFTLIKPQLDANAERYTNGIKGGREIKVTDEMREQIKEDKVLINNVSYLNKEDYKYLAYLYMIKELKVLGEYELHTHTFCPSKAIPPR